MLRKSGYESIKVKPEGRFPWRKYFERQPPRYECDGAASANDCAGRMVGRQRQLSPVAYMVLREVMPQLASISRRGREPPTVKYGPFPSLKRVALTTNSNVVGGLIMTKHTLENGRRNFLLTIAGGIAGLKVGSWPARALAQPAGGRPLSIGTIGAGREGGALGALFIKAGRPVMFSSRNPDTLKGLVDELGPLASATRPRPGA
jgi:hypothetical protein